MLTCNFPQNSTELTLAKMQDSPYEFVLTGSRHFGGHNHESDWDFFVLDSPEVREFLGRIGIRPPRYYDEYECRFCPAPSYNDSAICEVFEGCNIHVQLIKTPEFFVAKKVVNNKARNILRNLPKNIRKRAWDELLALVLT